MWHTEKKTHWQPCQYPSCVLLLLHLQCKHAVHLFRTLTSPIYIYIHIYIKWGSKYSALWSRKTCRMNGMQLAKQSMLWDIKEKWKFRQCWENTYTHIKRERLTDWQLHTKHNNTGAERAVRRVRLSYDTHTQEEDQTESSRQKEKRAGRLITRNRFLNDL